MSSLPPRPPAPAVAGWHLAHVVLVIRLALLATCAAADDVDYASQIKPVLAERCFACHGALKQEGGLRLDAVSLLRKGGDSGPVIVSGDAGSSVLIDKVTAEDPDERMPPAGEPLTAEQVVLFRAWIDQGALAPDEPVPVDPRRHWAFQPPVAPAVPDAAASWIRNEIDCFVAAGHREHGLQAVGEAPRATLLRRVYLDLIGLPPTRDELRDFLDDDSSQAYEQVIDRLLDSPRYGERWGRHWMDVWRYSDPSGYGDEIRDGRQHVWRWRDWIIDSLNSDKGYDRMITEMLAADEVAPQDMDALRASGFLARNWYKFNRNLWLDNIVEHTSKAFLGITMNCSRCHDHKYDPIAQLEYYRMRAIFEPHDLRDDPLGGATAAVVRAFDADASAVTYPFFQGDERHPDTEHPVTPGVPAVFGNPLQIEPLALPVLAYYPALRPEIQAATLQQADDEIDAARDALAAAEQAVVESELALSQPTAADLRSEPVGTDPDGTNLPGKVFLADDFTRLDTDRWTAEGGRWTSAGGRLIQDRGNTAQYRLLSRTDHPRDFRARLRFRITGGEMWRSVGLGFDSRGRAMNAVYLSAFSPGSKVQVTTQDDGGQWEYPQAGAHAYEVALQRDYVLEVAVRDRLMNVRVDGQLLIVFRLPADRPAGKLAIWTFSAQSEFDEIHVERLAPGVALATTVGGAGALAPPSAAELQFALNSARAKLEIARLHLVTVEAERKSLLNRYRAERAKYGLDRGDTVQLASAAARAQRQAAVRRLEEQVARDRQQLIEAERALRLGDAKAEPAVAKARQALETHNAELADARHKQTSETADYPPLGPTYPRESTGRRLALARWITDRQNPLTARVAVNHIWLRHFDAPLVENTFDFGLRSRIPPQSALLDWLAVRFMEDGWSMKKLHKRIVTSGVYRLSSSAAGAADENHSSDPDNRLLWRMNARRMEAEAVRDSVLYMGGNLDETMGGPPVAFDKGQIVPRRSIYFSQDKERQMVFLSLFDGAKVNECYRRKATVAPQQALAMYNSSIALTQARALAEKFQGETDLWFVIALFQQVLCRTPTQEETAECEAFLRDGSDPASARRQLALVLLNHNDFVTIR